MDFFSFQKDIRVSLIFSMLQQMLMEDKCDQVRSVCCKSLAMVINEIDDESRLSQVKFFSAIIDDFSILSLLQCIELLDRCLSDTSDVVQSAKRYFLPSIAMWCLELNKICHILIEHYLFKLQSLVQVRCHSLSHVDGFIFVCRVFQYLCRLIMHVLCN